jgi:BlaR1 peptidase M56
MSSVLAWLPEGGGPRLLCDALWQSTLIAGFGRLATQLIVRQSAAKAWLMLLTLTACVVAPLASMAARGSGWTILVGNNVGAEPRGAAGAGTSSLSQDLGERKPANIHAPPAAENSANSAALPQAARPTLAKASANQTAAAPVPTFQSTALSALGIAWLTASALLGVRLALSCLATWRLLRGAIPCRDEALLSASAAAATRIGLRRPPMLMVSRDVQTPTIFALGIPRLLIPSDHSMRAVAGKSIDWTAAFTHELAHVARGDGWARLWVEFVLIALPLQPLVWLARRAFHTACEETCDDWAVATGSNPVDLADTLTAWINGSNPAAGLVTIGMSSTRSRTLRLLALRSKPIARLNRAWRWVGLPIGLLLIAGLAIAQSPAEQTKDPPPKLMPPTDNSRTNRNESGARTGELAAETAGKGGPNGGDVWLDRIAVGEVCVGSTVEASVRVFYDASDTAGLSAKVDPPPFVRIKSAVLGSQNFGVRDLSFCDISLSINTLRGAGDLAGSLRVEIGKQVRQIPISATVLARAPDRTRVLVVPSPFSGWMVARSSDLDPWLKLVKSAKLNVDYLLNGQAWQSPLRDEDLSKFDVIFVGDDGVVLLQPHDLEKLRAYLDQGGRVVVAASHFMVGSVEKTNDLILPYGLQMVDSELAGRSTLQADDIAPDPLTHEVRLISVRRPTPIVLRSLQPYRDVPRISRKILVKYPKVPSDSREALVASAKVGKGELAVLGVPLPLLWMTKDGDTEPNCDNARLLQNLLTVRPPADQSGSPHKVNATGYDTSHGTASAPADPSKLFVVALESDESNTWRWRIFLPKGHRYAWKVAYDNIPRLKPPAEGSTKIMTGISNEDYWKIDNEVLVTAKLRRQDNGDWRLSVDSKINSGTGKPADQMFGASIDIPDARLKWMKTAPGTDGQVLGDHGDVAIDPTNQIVLLQRRPNELQPDGTYLPAKGTAPGFMIWLEKL